MCKFLSDFCGFSNLDIKVVWYAQNDRIATLLIEAVKMGF